MYHAELHTFHDLNLVCHAETRYNLVLNVLQLYFHNPTFLVFGKVQEAYMRSVMSVCYTEYRHYQL